jgi:hypothetical protein
VHGADDTFGGLIGLFGACNGFRELGLANGDVRLVSGVLRVAVFLERRFRNVELLLRGMQVRRVERWRGSFTGAIVRCS